MAKIFSSIACNLDAGMLSAALPLLAEGRLDALEWSFDTLFKVKEIPDWFTELLHSYSKEGRLVGHGVFFSLFSGKWLPEQEEWLRQLRQLCTRYSFDHITEHFGYMTGADFHKGAPLHMPFTPATLAIGQDRLKRLSQACERPVGLENLAFACSMEAVKRHGDFLEQLVAPVNGFIILDLHNLYCQLHNFNLELEDLIDFYPLDRVREIHLSGGSWQTSAAEPGRNIRRDTHDDAVPTEVFRLLEQTIDKCPHLRYVVLEQLGSALVTEESRQQFAADFGTMEQIVQRCNQTASLLDSATFLPRYPLKTDVMVEDALLYQQQRALAAILETAMDYNDALVQLKQSPLAHSAWEIESWQPAMVEAAMHITRKWKEGF